MVPRCVFLAHCCQSCWLPVQLSSSSSEAIGVGCWLLVGVDREYPCLVHDVGYSLSRIRIT